MPLPQPKTVLIAPTAFKGTMTAIEAAEAIAEVLSKQWPETTLFKCPLADGGDSTLLVLQYHRPELKLASIEVMGPLPAMQVQAQVGYLEADQTLIIEAAQAHGIAHLSPLERDPFLATSYGVGELIQNGLKLFPQAKHLTVTLGGSASTDGGVGALQALGWIFRDRTGIVLPSPLSAANLCQIESVQENSAYLTFLSEQLQSITLATDVTNPLLGELGCVRAYGPQKGISPEQLRRFEAGLLQLSQALNTLNPKHIPPSHPRTGAAGGLAYGLATLPNTTLTSGFHWIMSQTALTTWLTQSDLILTGEGRFDATSLQGKVLGELLTQRGNTPTLILTGQCEFPQEILLTSCHMLLFPDSQLISPQETLKRTLHEYVRFNTVF